MKNFNDYIAERLDLNPGLKKNFWKGYEDFKIGALLKEARLEAGLTQEQIAKKLKTTKSVISRMENHSEDIRLSTLKKFAEALDKHLLFTIE